MHVDETVTLAVVRACFAFGQRAMPGQLVECPVALALAAVKSGHLAFRDAGDRQRCQALAGAAAPTAPAVG